MTARMLPEGMHPLKKKANIGNTVDFPKCESICLNSCFQFDVSQNSVEYLLLGNIVMPFNFGDSSIPY